MKTVLVLLILATAAGCAWAEEPETIKQVSLGAYFITESTPDFDPSTGLAISYFRLTPRNWYTSAEVGFYEATVFYTPEGTSLRRAATVDVTTWAFIIGRATRSDDGKSYVGLGVGWLVDDDVDLGYGVRFESSTPLGWEVIAGTARKPLGLQVRYCDGGMPANRGVTAAVSFSW